MLEQAALVYDTVALELRIVKICLYARRCFNDNALSFIIETPSGI